jgi:hypothetical protein
MNVDLNGFNASGAGQTVKASVAAGSAGRRFLHLNVTR